jgi:hypothetical protein
MFMRGARSASGSDESPKVEAVVQEQSHAGRLATTLNDERPENLALSQPYHWSRISCPYLAHTATYSAPHLRHQGQK